MGHGTPQSGHSRGHSHRTLAPGNTSTTAGHHRDHQLTIKAHLAGLLVEVFPGGDNAHLFGEVGPGHLGLVIGASGGAVALVPRQGGEGGGDGGGEGGATAVGAEAAASPSALLVQVQAELLGRRSLLGPLPSSAAFLASFRTISIISIWRQGGSHVRRLLRHSVPAASLLEQVFVSPPLYGSPLGEGLQGDHGHWQPTRSLGEQEEPYGMQTMESVGCGEAWARLLR